jgi:hypothetical protein
MKCKQTLLMHVLDATESLHVLAELLRHVVPDAYDLDGALTITEQQRAIERVLKQIERAEFALDTFRPHVSPEQDTPADQLAFELAARRIRERMFAGENWTAGVNGPKANHKILPGTSDYAI